MKSNHTSRIQSLSAVLLILWAVIILGFFSITLLGHLCLAQPGGCTVEFLHEVETMNTTVVLVQFAFFFFIPVICEICLPENISHALLEPAFRVVSNPNKVVSPPPRSFH